MAGKLAGPPANKGELIDMVKLRELGRFTDRNIARSLADKAVWTTDYLQSLLVDHDHRFEPRVRVAIVRELQSRAAGEYH